MDKNTAIKLISKDIYRNLTLEKNCRENLNVKLKLIPLIDKIKEENNINHEINIDEVLIQLKKDNEEYHSNIEIFIKNQTYFVYFKKDKIDNEELFDAKLETKIIMYSIFILLNISLYSFISSFINENAILDIIKPLFFLFLYILLVFKRKENMAFLFLSIAVISILEAKNLLIIGCFFLFFLINMDLKYDYKKFGKDEQYYRSLRPLSLFVLGVSFVLLYSFSKFFENIDQYIFAKSILLTFIILSFSILNRLNILQLTLFFIMSFSAYNLIMNMAHMLHEKNIIFYPYTDTINLEVSILSIAISILVFSNSTIIYFYEKLFTITHWSNILGSLILFIVLAPVFFFFIASILSSFTSHDYILIISLYIIFSLIMLVLVSMIFFVNKSECKVRFLNFIFSLEKKIFNQNNKIKKINWFKTFFAPLNKAKNIEFDEKNYSKNMCFIFISIYIIFNFFTNYPQIYHYSANENYKICKNLDDSVFLSVIAGQSFVYALYDEDYKNTLDEKIQKLDIEFQVNKTTLKILVEKLKKLEKELPIDNIKKNEIKKEIKDFEIAIKDNILNNTTQNTGQSFKEKIKPEKILSIKQESSAYSEKYFLTKRKLYIFKEKCEI